MGDAVAGSSDEREPELEPLLDALARASAHLLIVTDADRTIRSCSRGTTDLLGRPVGALVGVRLDGVVHGDADLELDTVGGDGADDARSAPSGAAADEARWTFVHADGSPVPVAVERVPLTGDDGGAGWLIIGHDLRGQLATEAHDRLVSGQFEAVFDVSPAPGLIIDANDNRILAVNRAFVRLLRWTDAQIVGRPASTIGPLRLPTSLAAIGDPSTSGQSDAVETLDAADGSVRYVHVTVRPIQWRGTTQLIVLLRDETERERLRGQLRQSEQTLQSFLDFAPALISARDRTGQPIVRNRRYLDLFVLPGDEPDADGNRRTVTPELIEWSATLDRRVFETNLEQHGERVVVEPDGTEKVWEFTKFPLRSDDGEAYAVGTFALDVTEDHRARHALAASEERFRQMAANLDEVFLLWEEETYDILYVSPTVERIVGLDPAAFRDPAARLAIVHPDDRHLMSPPMPPVLEVRITKPDGSERWLRSRTTTVPMPEGQPNRGVTTMMDVTEQKQAELAEIEARLEAEQANQAKSEFLSRMSHELRTPLNAIVGFGQLLEMDDSLADTPRRHVAQITNASHHLLDLINELLDIARIESGEMAVALEPVPLKEVVEDTVSLLDPLAAQRGVRIVVEPIDPTQHVLADRRRLAQVVLNIVTNAVKYNHRGGQARVWAAPASPGRISLVVADTGPGIAAADLDRLFTPFTRLAGADREVEGTGLGLAVCQRLIGLMDGTIGVESTPGRGSRFWVELPASAPPP